MTVNKGKYTVFFKGDLPVKVDAGPGGSFEISHSGALLFINFRNHRIRAFREWAEVVGNG